MFVILFNVGLINLFLVLIALFILSKTIVIVRPHERGVRERLGKYKDILEPGIHIIVPLLDRVIKVPLAEQRVDVPPADMITRDNATVKVDAVVYFKIIDPCKAIYNVLNYKDAIINLAIAKLRAEVGKRELDELLEERERMNAAIKEVLDKETDLWGITITRVEIVTIEPPPSIKEAMEKQIAAERQKRAMILESEGYKQSQINKAEGDKQSMVLRAQGEAEAIKLKAEAQAEAIRKIVQALREEGGEKYLQYLYMQILPQLTEGKGKVIIPYKLPIDIVFVEGEGNKIIPIKKGENTDKS